MTSLDPDVRALLVCPVCRGELEDEVHDGAERLVCPMCRLAFPVEDGVPFLVPELARRLPDPS